MEKASDREENLCYISNVLQGFRWANYLMITMVIVPAAIVIFNLCLFYRVIPEWFTLKYVILTYAHPNILSMFLSNYAHVNILHLQENMFSYIVTVIMITAVAIIAIPSANRKEGGNLNCRFGTKTLVQSTLVFFFLMPLFVSVTSVMIGPSVGMPNGVGFSGIGYAFEGYLIYICVILIIRKTQVMYKREGTAWMMFGGGLLLLLIAIPIMFMHPTANSNYIAHLTGFVAGFMTPLLLERVGDRKIYIQPMTSISSKGENHGK